MGPTLFDAHVHLDRLDEPTEAIQRARQGGIRGFLLPSVGVDSWKAQKEIAHKEEDVHVAYGLHPWYAATLSDEERLRDLGALRRLVDKEKPAALGEMGLDHHPHFEKKSYSAQEKAFVAQLAMAHLLELPVVLHVVQAHGACLGILRDMGAPRAGGMVHSFTGSLETAQAYVRMGLSISFSGSVTRSHARKAREAARSLPLEQILVETDAPDQLPSGRDASQNEPAFLSDIVACIAELRNADPLDVAAQTEQNARKLFRL